MKNKHNDSGREANTTKFYKKKLPLFIRSVSVLGALAVSAPALSQNQPIEEILVTGQRASILSAQEIKRNAEQIVDSIVADDIGKLPDRSVTETLQRVPGVTIERFLDIGDPEHFSAEGSGVAIRGMKNVRSELNGRDSFSAAGGRSLSFEDVPAELMAGVDVYKNPSADMIEGGLGGTVNLRTKMPFDSEGQTISGSASINYGDFIEESDPSASILYSNRWDTEAGEFGFLINLATSEISTRTDGVFLRPFFARTDILEDGQTAWIPRGADWRSMNFNRERLGSYAAFQWRPDDRSEAYFTVFRSQYEMQWDEDAIFVQNDPWSIQLGEDSVFDENGVFVSGRLSNAEPPEWAPQIPGIPFGADIRVSTRESITTDFAGGYKWLPSDSWEMSTDLQYTKSTTETLDSTVATGINLEYLDIDLRRQPPSIRTDAEFLADPTNYYWGFAQPHIEDAEASQFSWRADAEYRFEHNIVRSFKFGVRYTDREADNINTSYHWVGIFQPWMTTDWDGGLNINDLGMPYMQDASMMTLNTFDNFFRGGADLEGVVWAPNLAIAKGYPDSYIQLYADAAAYADSLGHPYSNVYGPYELRNRNDEEWRNVQEEQTYAAYGLLRFGFDDLAMPVDGSFGVRIVQTEAVARGHIVYPDTLPFGDGSSEAFAATNSYTNVLPSLNLRLQITDELIARVAVSQAMSRIDFSQMQAFMDLNADVDDTTGAITLSGSSWGNPDLKPLESDQADLSFEWYFNESGGMAHLNFFYKDIDGIVRNQVVTETYGAFDYSITRPVNAGTARIKGFEIGYSQFFDFLPSPFDGLGMQVNYTYIDSTTSVPISVNPDDGSLIAPVDTDGTLVPGVLPYEGLSKNAFNVVGMFEKGPLSARLAWSWRSEYLMSIGPNGFNGDDAGIDNSFGDTHWKLPIYSDDSGQLDGSIFYDITDNVSIGLEANNLTNEETRTIMKQGGAGNNYASYFVNDRRYALTLRASF